MSGAKSYRDIITDDSSLAVFLRQLSKFDQTFCDLMASGADFTLRLEVRGNQGYLLHARSYSDEIERPDGVEKKIDAAHKKSQKPSCRDSD